MMNEDGIVEFNVDMNAYNNDGADNSQYLIPDGDYLLEVKDVVPRESKKGLPQLVFRLDLAETDEDWECNDRVYNTITFIPKGKKGHGIAVHFLKCLGIVPSADGKMTFNLDFFIGRKIYGHIYSEKGQDGQYYNRVNDIKPTDDIAPEPKAANEDDVPF